VLQPKAISQTIFAAQRLKFVEVQILVGSDSLG
jgi:hypothetical protein